MLTPCTMLVETLISSYVSGGSCCASWSTAGCIDMLCGCQECMLCTTSRHAVACSVLHVHKPTKQPVCLPFRCHVQRHPPTARQYQQHRSAMGRGQRHAQAWRLGHSAAPIAPGVVRQVSRARLLVTGVQVSVGRVQVGGWVCGGGGGGGTRTSGGK